MTMISRDLTGSMPAHGEPGRTFILSNTPAATPNFYSAGGKRLLDIVIIGVSAPIWLPLIMVLALVIMIVDRQSPFYTQKRLGRNGRAFRLWKLRTMVADADERLEAYLAENPEARAEWNASQKLKNDPRITRTGIFLRKTSLDEFPQLFNVLFGDMSLVGPRPIMVNQRDIYPGTRYYQLRPGLTGLWQISDRNDSEFVGRVRFDDAYHRVVSLKTDLSVMLRTFGVMVRGTGY